MGVGMMKQPRVKNKAHCDFIRSLPCIICADNVSLECAHIRMSDAGHGKNNPGVGARPSDCYTLPLCGAHHRAQHKFGNERLFWNTLELDPIAIALALYEVTGDHEKGCEIIANAGKPVNILIAG